jgi:hypothetical protein
MDDKKPLIFVLVFFGIIAAVAYPKVQWFRFEMQVRDVFSDQKGIGRFPPREKLVEVDTTIQNLAKPFGYEPMDVKLRLVQQSHGPVVKWYFGANMTHGGNSFDIQRWIETPLSEDDVEWYTEAGIAVTGTGYKDD